MPELDLAYAPLDSRRFGRRIWRGQVRDEDGARAALDLSARERIDLLIVRCPADGLRAVQVLERAGFFLADTLVYYRGATDRFAAAAAPAGIVLRPLQPGDEDALGRIAGACFADYQGHYHADPHLPREASTAGYVEWALSTAQDPAFDVLVAATSAGEVCGFLSLRREGAEAGDIVLNAVAPAQQGRGIYDALVKAAGNLLRERGARHVTASTQLSNLAPQKVWVRNGLQPSGAVYTLHGWFSGPGARAGEAP
jgi:ribosomal protein S18 acetylase RimI-like enzyme